MLVGRFLTKPETSLQQAGLDYVYQNMITFLEVAGLHAAKSVSHTTADILETRVCSLLSPCNQRVGAGCAGAGVNQSF